MECTKENDLDKGPGTQGRQAPRLLWSGIIVVLAIVIAWVTPAQGNDLVAQRMAEVVPEISPDSIQPASVPGMFEVRYGTDIFYVTEDARFLFQGSLIDLDGRENLTEQSRQSVRSESFASIPDAGLVVFAPPGEIRHVLNIFTDPQCPHCRRLHQEMEQYLEAGIKIRYFMLPVVGQQSPTIMRNIWCAEDRTAAMDLAKSGRSVPTADCVVPDTEHLLLARSLGINGTPAMISDAGLLVSGYRAAGEMVVLLESQ